MVIDFYLTQKLSLRFVVRIIGNPPISFHGREKLEPKLNQQIPSAASALVLGRVTARPSCQISLLQLQRLQPR